MEEGRNEGSFDPFREDPFIISVCNLCSNSAVIILKKGFQGRQAGREEKGRKERRKEKIEKPCLCSFQVEKVFVKPQTSSHLYFTTVT